jgi:hypothetical protein
MKKSRLLGAVCACFIGAATAGAVYAAPITDTVTINGTEWAQVNLFLNLSWNDINACVASIG